MLLGIVQQAAGILPGLSIAAPIVAFGLGQVVLLIWTLSKVHSQGKANAQRLDSIDAHISDHCKELKENTLAINTLNVKMEATEKMVDEIRVHQGELAKAARR